jgi:hypothetical protein
VCGARYARPPRPLNDEAIDPMDGQTNECPRISTGGPVVRAVQWRYGMPLLPGMFRDDSVCPKCHFLSKPDGDGVVRCQNCCCGIQFKRGEGAVGVDEPPYQPGLPPNRVWMRSGYFVVVRADGTLRVWEAGPFLHNHVPEPPGAERDPSRN